MPKKVSYIENGERRTGRLLFIVKSKVAPEFDTAYIDFGKYWKVALKSELIGYKESPKDIKREKQEPAKIEDDGEELPF